MFCPEQLAAAVTAAATILSKGRSVDDITLFAVVFTQLGDTLSTIATQKSICEGQKNDLPPGVGSNE